MLNNEKNCSIIDLRLRWDYMNNNLLVSTAMLSAFWEKERKDIFDLLTPFVKYSIAKTTEVGGEISTPELLAYLKREFGYETLPTNTVFLILNRLSPSVVSRSKGRYYLKTQLDEDVKRFQKRRLTHKEHAESVAAVLSDYLNSHLLKRYTPETALTALIDFFVVNGMCVISDSEQLELIKNKDDKQNYCVARFITTEHEKESVIFEYILDMANGFFVSTAISLQPENTAVTTAKFKSLNCYLDTRVIMNALGMCSETERAAAVELLNMLKEKGATIYCYDHVYRELHSIISAYKTSLLPPYSYSFHTLEGWESKGYTPVDVERFQTLLPYKLNAIGIAVVSTPDFASAPQKYPFSDADFSKYICEKIQYNRKDALDNDIKSIAATLWLRSGFTTEAIENCKAIFVTSNTQLTNRARAFLVKEGILRSGCVMPIITDIEFSSIVWLKCYSTHKDYPAKKLIEHSLAALEPTDELMKAFIHTVDKMQTDGEISYEEAIAMKIDSFCRRELARITKGDASSVDETVIHSIRGAWVECVTGGAIQARDSAIRDSQMSLEKYAAEKAKNRQMLKRIVDNANKKSSRTAKAVSVLLHALAYLTLAAFAVMSVVFAVKGFNRHEFYVYAVVALVGDVFGIVDFCSARLKNIHKFIKQVAYKAGCIRKDRLITKMEGALGVELKDLGA